MDLAYAAADVVVTRSGASTVSELCAMEKATIFVPSPNVAEDHQTHNAMALVNKDAAMIVKDRDAVEKLIPTAMELLRNPEKIAYMERNIEDIVWYGSVDSVADMAAQVGVINSAPMKQLQVICDEAYKILGKK